MGKRFADIDSAMQMMRIAEGYIGTSVRSESEIAAALLSSRRDAVEVVRCTDCRYGLKSSHMLQRKCICPETPAHFVRDDGFCNFGKKRG